MSLRRPFAAAALAAVNLLLASVALASPWALQPGNFYSELSGSFYSTQTFYRNHDEAREQLYGRLEQRALRSHNEFGWKKWATMWIDVPFVSRTFVPDVGTASTSTGLGDLDFGLRIPILTGNLPVALELGWVAPLGTNRALFPGTSGSGGLHGYSIRERSSAVLRDSSLFFSQGLQSLSASLELGGALGGRSYWTLGGGYRTTFLSAGKRKVNDRYADFAVGGATLGLWMSDHLLVSGGASGVWQVSQGGAYDRHGPIPDPNGPDLQTVSMLVGPRFTYRIDDKMDVFAGSWHTPAGRNVLHQDQFYAGIAWKHTGLDRLAGALGGTKAR